MPQTDDNDGSTRRLWASAIDAELAEMTVPQPPCPPEHAAHSIELDVLAYLDAWIANDVASKQVLVNHTDTPRFIEAMTSLMALLLTGNNPRQAEAQFAIRTFTDAQRMHLARHVHGTEHP